MYNPKTLDPQYKEALDNATELLQKFIDRQCYLRKLVKEKGRSAEIIGEQYVNIGIIPFIQWVRYHFWGNDDTTIINKTNITRWTFTANAEYSSYYIHQSPFACDALGFDRNTFKVSATEIVEAILNIIIPKREHSIFAVDDQITESINLKYELDRIKSKIYDL